MINFTFKETFLTRKMANDQRRIETLKEVLVLCVLWSESGDKRVNLERNKIHTKDLNKREFDFLPSPHMRYLYFGQAVHRTPTTRPPGVVRPCFLHIECMLDSKVFHFSVASFILGLRFLGSFIGFKTRLKPWLPLLHPVYFELLCASVLPPINENQ